MCGSFSLPEICTTNPVAFEMNRLGPSAGVGMWRDDEPLLRRYKSVSLRAWKPVRGSPEDTPVTPMGGLSTWDTNIKIGKRTTAILPVALRIFIRPMLSAPQWLNWPSIRLDVRINMVPSSDIDFLAGAIITSTHRATESLGVLNEQSLATYARLILGPSYGDVKVPPLIHPSYKLPNNL